MSRLAILARSLALRSRSSVAGAALARRSYCGPRALSVDRGGVLAWSVVRGVRAGFGGKGGGEESDWLVTRTIQSASRNCAVDS